MFSNGALTHHVLVIQVIGDWVASHTHEEVLAVMAEARVPSGQTVRIYIPAVPKAVQYCA